MLKAVLFDIDNTLILYDEYAFFSRYIPEVTKRFADIIPPEGFPQRLIGATQKLMQNDGSRPNHELFLDHFTKDYEDRREEFWGRFMAFYDTEFDAFRELVKAPEGITAVFRELEALGLKLVLASNPIWPEEVQRMRAGWAGIDRTAFDFITHIGNMSFCKPKLGYYLEICEKTGIGPHECLMVGNDRVNDMIAGRTGMKTFLTCDGDSIDRSSLAMSREIGKHGDETAADFDFSGLIAELPAAVRSLLGGA